MLSMASNNFNEVGCYLSPLSFLNPQRGLGQPPAVAINTNMLATQKGKPLPILMLQDLIKIRFLQAAKMHSIPTHLLSGVPMEPVMWKAFPN